MPHYFGVAQNLAPLAAFCEQYGLALIEDCSHAFVGPGENTPQKFGLMGKTGRFCVSSPYKFFPSQDGGLLWTNEATSPHGLKPAQAGLQREIKGLAQALQKTFASVSPLNIKGIKDELSSLASTPVAIGRDIEEHTESWSDHYALAEENMQSLAASRWIFRHTDCTALVNLRRQNYLAWLDGIAKLPFCQALFPKLSADCVPYMFPLRLDHPEIHFYALKLLGVPVWRWDDMAVSDCPVATKFRLNLLHLPCHQSLSAEQLAWMIAAVAQVLSQKTFGAPP